MGFVSWWGGETNVPFHSALLLMLPWLRPCWVQLKGLPLPGCLWRGHEVGSEGRAVDVVYLDFSEAFDTVCHKILTDKLMKCGLDEQTARWDGNWLNGRAQRVVIIGQSPVGGQQLVVYPRGQCWVQSCLSFSLMVWVMGQSVPSASLQMIPDWEEWVTHRGSCCCPEGSQQDRKSVV